MALDVPNKDEVVAALRKCSTVVEVLRVRHRACRRHRNPVPPHDYSYRRPLAQHMRTAGVTGNELRLCQKLYPGVRLARLDRRTRSVRALLVHRSPARVAGGTSDSWARCGSSNVRVDHVTADAGCRSCGSCVHQLCASWHELCPGDTPRTRQDCDRVFELFHHVCDRFHLGHMCRERACFLYRKCRMKLKHLESPEYVECACLLLAARSCPSRHNFKHAK